MIKKNVLLSVCITLALLSLFTISNLYSAYLENLPIAVEQPDGTVINCLSSGDEFFNWLHDENGFTIIRGEDGFLYYAIRVDGEPAPSEFRADSGMDPRTLGLTPNVGISVEEYNRRRAVLEDPMRDSNVRAPHEGVMNNLVVYIRFSDDSEFTIPRSTYDNRFNNPEGVSLKNYFLETSYDLLEIDSHHFPIAPMNTNLSYQDSHPRSYYQPYHSVTNPNGYSGDYQRRIREHTLLMNAVNYIADEVPPDLDIDADNDGHVDNVSFIIRGNSGAWADLLWAHRWVLYSFYVYIHGARVYDYTFQPENQCGVSTLSHEMFHTLGAPDLYRYSHDGFVPVGPWDLMASGFVHMGAWMKYKYSDNTWITNIPEITSSGTYTLNPLTSPENNAYKIISPFSQNEFFILEYRRTTGLYESQLPGSGLLVYRINGNINGNASGPPDEVYIYRPNGTTNQNGFINMAHFSSNVNRTAINDETTNPTSFLSNGQPGGLNIYNIGAAEETISFEITLVGDLVPPHNIYPSDDDNIVPVNLTFNWSNVYVADFYDFQLSLDPGFEELIINEIYLLDNFLEVEGLTVGQDYYWRTRSINYDGFSDWSNTWTFSTCYYSSLETEMGGVIFGKTVAADMNNNGFMDIVVSARNFTGIYWNQGDGTFIQSTQDFPNYTTTSIAVADFNNDGWLDFVVTGSKAGNIRETYVYLNQQNGYFNPLPDELVAVSNGTVEVGDFDNSGNIDIIITGDDGESYVTYIYQNNGTHQEGSFFTEVVTNIPGVIASDIALGDYNNNGMLDITISGNSDEGPYTALYKNLGNLEFASTDNDFIGLVGSSVNWGDFTNNGYYDLVVSGMLSPGETYTKIYQNLGEGNFELLDTDLIGVNNGNSSWGDFNQNGQLDLLVSGRNNTVLYMNQNGTFEAINSGVPNISNGFTQFADMDNNGFLDIITMGSTSTGAILEVYINDIESSSFVSNTPPSTPENLTVHFEGGSGNNVILSWEQAFDNETSSSSLSYNVRVGTTPGGQEITPSHSDLTSGFRMIPKTGNTFLNNSYTIKNLSPGTYYWSVQTIDSGLMASPFSETHSFKVEETSTGDTSTPALQTALHDNYPNPFNPYTLINFTIATEERVKIEIFNLRGQLVKTLINDIMGPGNHEIRWDGKNSSNVPVGSGLYFYKMTTNSYSAVQKMLMLK